MRYLSFDIECCDGVHICEFGYVITNEQFEVIDKKVFTINPEKPFNLIGRKNQDDLILFFPQEVYCASPVFATFYNKIKALIEYPDQIIIGHAIGNDAAFLRTACKRYKLPPLNFDFVDSQKVYSEFANDKKRISLEKAEELFNLDKPQYLHKSDDDALLTIQLIEKICGSLEMRLPELISLCPNACGRSHNFNIMYTGNSLKEMLETLSRNASALSNNKKQLCIRKFIEVVQPTTEIRNGILNGTKICFSTGYERDHTKETIILIQLLSNCGCSYNFKVSDNDYYVATASELNDESNDNKHSRYYAATHREDGHIVKVISLQDLCNILGINEESLSTMEMPAVPKRTKQKSRVCYSSGKATITLGDIFKMSGIDLKNIS